MIKDLKDYELLIEYFKSVRTHSVSIKYALIEASKVMLDDFTDTINDNNRIVMQNYEIDYYKKKLDLLKDVFNYSMFITKFCEDEIKRFKKEIELISIDKDNIN